MEKIEYIYDEKGNIKAVIVPIRLWEEIKKKIFNPSEFRGMYKHLNLDPEKESKELRDEWERDF